MYGQNGQSDKMWTDLTGLHLLWVLAEAAKKQDLARDCEQWSRVHTFKYTAPQELVDVIKDDSRLMGTEGAPPWQM